MRIVAASILFTGSNWPLQSVCARVGRSRYRFTRPAKMPTPPHDGLAPLLIRASGSLNRGTAALFVGIAANLFLITSARQPPNPNGGPPQLAHQLRQPPARACGPISLRNFQNIERSLRGNAFDAIVTNFPAQPF